MEQSTQTKQLTVEDTSLINGLGVIVALAIPVSEYSGPPSIKARLRKPNGEETLVRAQLQIPKVSPPARVQFLLVLAGCPHPVERSEWDRDLDGD